MKNIINLFKIIISVILILFNCIVASSKENYDELNCAEQFSHLFTLNDIKYPKIWKNKCINNNFMSNSINEFIEVIELIEQPSNKNNYTSKLKFTSDYEKNRVLYGTIETVGHFFAKEINIYYNDDKVQKRILHMDFDRLKKLWPLIIGTEIQSSVRLESYIIDNNGNKKIIETTDNNKIHVMVNKIIDIENKNLNRLKVYEIIYTETYKKKLNDIENNEKIPKEYQSTSIFKYYFSPEYSVNVKRTYTRKDVYVDLRNNKETIESNIFNVCELLSLN